MALCTYNGAEHLPFQLRSIAAQSRPPDEVIVCDDCSTDQSLRVIRDFAATAGFPVYIHKNEVNVGSTRNFERAVRKCSGDVVFLSDQDDVWHQNKIEILLELFAKSENVGLVFSDAELVDENLKPVGRRSFQALGFSKRRQTRVLNGAAFETLVQRNFILGGAAAFRREYVNMAYPFPTEWVHDAWIALIIAAQAGLAFTRKSLTLYRQHSMQQLGLGRNLEDELTRASSRDPKFRRKEALAYDVARNRFLKIEPDRFAYHASLLNEKSHHFLTRARIPEGPTRERLMHVGREIVTGRYFQFSSGWRSVAKDLCT